MQIARERERERRGQKERETERRGRGRGVGDRHRLNHALVKYRNSSGSMRRGVEK